jgi:hypothetical protein
LIIAIWSMAAIVAWFFVLGASIATGADSAEHAEPLDDGHGQNPHHPLAEPFSH